jgi:hypothetical protein
MKQQRKPVAADFYIEGGQSRRSEGVEHSFPGSLREQKIRYGQVRGALKKFRAWHGSHKEGTPKPGLNREDTETQQHLRPTTAATGST